MRVVIAGALVCAIVLIGPGAAQLLSSDALIAQIIGQVSEDNIREHICWLQSREGGEFCNPYGSRWSCDGAAIDRAMNYVRQHFERLGLRTQLVPYSLPCRPGLSYNIEAELPGTESTQLVLLTAHLDSYSATVRLGSPAPGADDNASGSAAVLEAARILSQYKFKHTIRFVLFTGEEQWMVGSSAYAAAMARDNIPILGVFNMDMIGYDSDDNGFFEVWVGGPQESQRLADLIVDTVQGYNLNLVSEVLDDPRRGGDQAPFWRRRYPAVMVIEDTEYGATYDFNPTYHTTAETLDLLNLKYARQIAQAVIAAAAQLAELKN